MIRDQNSTQNQAYLAAASDRYYLAKEAYGIRSILAALVPALATAYSGLLPSIRPWSALYGLVVLIADPFLFRPLYRKWKTEGARAQEMFDTSVLGIPWNSVAAGERLPEEDVAIWASRFRLRRASQRLVDWYPPSLCRLPSDSQTLAAQRINSFWDSNLRRRYGTSLSLSVAGLAVAAVVFALAGHLRVSTLVFALAGIGPAIQWAIREGQDQKHAASERRRLALLVVAAWRAALAPQSTPEQLAESVRCFQDAIYHRRRSDPEVFDWIYSGFRRTDERRMRAAANEMVREWEELEGYHKP